MSDQDEIISPFLQKVLDRRGLHDDQVTSLLIVERYQRHPRPKQFNCEADACRYRRGPALRGQHCASRG